MQDVELIADIVETYQRIGEGRSDFVFCVDRAHAKAVQAQFNGAGIRVQIVGRGLRAAPGKAGCLILDHSDNHSRLGFVTDIDCPELDDGSGEPRPSSGIASVRMKLPRL
jgi:superfamily II DNA or RNA helicase